MTKGERLKRLREKTGMLQVEAANRIGVSKQTLYKYEKNIVTNIPSNIIERMAVLYNTTPAYIFGWEDDDGNILVEHGIHPKTDLDLEEIMEAYRMYELYLRSDEKTKSFIDFLLQSSQTDVETAKKDSTVHQKEIPHLKKSEQNNEVPHLKKDTN